ncbi:hypothetical protein R1sor_020472 [Riccia sorocarpa]|uniref:Uncharacterized protein n=1 Tax=Riccia sorocarpa TaxID=122646 RepID=A0ABD3IFD4_9MARC
MTPTAIFKIHQGYINSFSILQEVDPAEDLNPIGMSVDEKADPMEKPQHLLQKSDLQRTHRKAVPKRFQTDERKTGTSKITRGGSRHTQNNVWKPKERKGVCPWYTRYAVRGERVDMAMLDRVYLSRNGVWADHAKRVDHILEREDTFRETDRIWKEHPKEGLDPRVKWILAWKRLKYFFKKIQGDRRKKLQELERMEEELQLLRIQSERDQSSTLAFRIAQLEQTVRTKENLEAALWRKRSRNRWFKECEAPSKYFFSQLKAKHQRESIKALKLDSGKTVTHDGRIMKEIECFFADLYKNEDRVEADKASRERVLSYVTTEVTPP